MMNRWTIVAATGLMALAVGVGAQETGLRLVQGHGEALRKAESLRVVFTLQAVGGAPSRFEIEMAKPNRLRLQTPERLVVADGEKITVFDRQSKQFFRKPQNEEAFREILQREEVMWWGPFFDESVLGKFDRARVVGERTRRGIALRAVETSRSGSAETSTLYIAPSDGVLRQAEFRSKESPVVTILDVQELALNPELGGEVFAFQPPPGAEEVDEAVLQGFRWLTDLDEALKLAKTTNRLVMVDFYTDWCTFCKRLEAEVFSSKEFQDMHKRFVFVKVDGDRNRELVERFKVSGYPTNIFLRPDGTQVHEIVGYVPKDRFLSEMQAALSKAGLDR